MIFRNNQFKKLGLIYGPNNDSEISWADNSFLTPTPFILDKSTIRIFGGLRDANGISRIGFIDVSRSKPNKILNVSKAPVLDIGEPGRFDDNGVMPCEVLRVGTSIYMYYAGFQLVDKIKFQAFTGLCISTDNGNSFVRYKETPVLDRSEDGLFIRTLHTIFKDNDLYKTWYVGGSNWETINGSDYANYQIYYSESKDGINFSDKGCLAIPCDLQNNEYRIGRPRVHKIGNMYEMSYTFSNFNGEVGSGYAYSEDGINWTRDDKNFPIIKSSTGWDSKSINYPYLLEVDSKYYVFYCGNNLGYEGFGCAETFFNKDL